MELTAKGENHGSTTFHSEEDEGLASGITLEQVKELLGVTDLPGDAQDMEDIVRYTQALVDKHGEGWIRRNRKRLLAEWDYIVSL